MHFRESPIREWPGWSYDEVSLPMSVHATASNWKGLLRWIAVNTPRHETSASEVQCWLLVTGMAIRDIQSANAVDPTEPESEVPGKGAEYLRESPSLFTDLADTILPAIRRAYHFLDQYDPLSRQAMVAAPRTS